MGHPNLPAETKIKSQTPPLPKEIFTSRKQGMEYFTTEGIIQRTGYTNKVDWYLLPIREILDNCVDFLWKNYKGSDKTLIETTLEMDDEIFHLKVRSSNDSNAPAFGDLEAIFDYNMRYGSKQDVHIISRGMLGDAMKQILSLGYVLLHVSDDGTQFGDKQWTYPLVIRYNYQEWNVYLTYDRATQYWDVKIGEPKAIPSIEIELELKLPVIDDIKNKLTRDYIEEFCRKYTLFTTDISFKFSILDDINHTHNKSLDEADVTEEFVKKLSKGPDRAILHIDLPALHPIAADWKNTPSIHSYKPEEFIRRLTGVHDKDNTTVYEILLEFREGSQIPKTPKNEMLISELVASKNKDKLMEKWYEELRATLPVQKELQLPYTDNLKKRREVSQSKFYDIDTERKYSYTLVRGKTYDSPHTDSLISYPFAFEILAIPLKNSLIQDNPALGRDTIFIGAINYSVSPKANHFPGMYHSREETVFNVLEYYGFRKNADNNVKIPCVIIGNLITPRRDPVGYDKSIIDIVPFNSEIIHAVRVMAAGIQTYRQTGNFNFVRYRGETSGKFKDKSKESGKEVLRQWLISEGRLPR